MATWNADLSDASGSNFSDTDSDSVGVDSDSDTASSKQNLCEFYNKGHCRYGAKCRNQHVCKYHLKGSCRYGASCRLSHTLSMEKSSGENTRGRGNRRRRNRSRSPSSDSGTDSSKPYRWQLDLGSGWQDVANDFVLEAQFSQPNNKGIRIYNTPCGALSIDFGRMSIRTKTNLRVRRKGSRHTEWLWYYRGNYGWLRFGSKDAQGKVSSVTSSSLEAEYQRNRRGTVQFSVDSTSYQISFKDMQQKNLSTSHQRRIKRRPKYVPQQGLSSLTQAISSISTSSSTRTPLWQFSGRKGNWHSFKKGSSCSVSNSDIEAEYRRNNGGSMSFTVNGDQYTLDFSQMTQTNQKTNAVRNIRRKNQ